MVKTNIARYGQNMNFRHADILERARRDGKVTVEGLAAAFDVTLQTIRRDLSELADLGRLERVHGGAILPSGIANIGYDDRRRLHEDAKAQIAQAAARRIKNGTSLFLGIGTTCEAVAQALVHHDGMLVVTNNLNAVPVLSSNGGCQVLVTGGSVRPADAGLVGAQAAQNIRQFKFDLAVIGCSAMDESGDLFDYDLDEVIVSQTVITESRATMLVADTSKFTRKAPARVASLSSLACFVTDARPVVLRPDVRGTDIVIAEG